MIVRTAIVFYPVLLLGLLQPMYANERPNFVVILADDVGQECLECYGGESYKTPNLNHLASTGMQFSHCYSMPTCHPTRLTLLTGRYPFRHNNAPWGSFPESAEATTFARLLADAGYATAVAGKWQLALLRDKPDHAARLGFQHSDIFGWHEGSRYYEPLIYRNGKIRNDTLGFYGPDLYVQSLIEFMKRHRDQPFLVYFPMALCHAVTDDLKLPVAHGPLDRYDSYPEMIAEMDRSIGRIMGALNALKLREKTLIIFVGDNGTTSRIYSRADGDRLVRVPVVSRRNGRDVLGGKGKLTDGGTRVPLIANWLGTVEGGQDANDLVDMSDFWPTLLDLAGVAPPSDHPVDGQSLAGRLTQQTPSPRKWAYSQGKKSRWVRTARWKLYGDGRLFDMSKSTEEENPAIATEDSQQESQIRRRLQSALDQLNVQ